MAENASNRLVYYLKIKTEYLDDLAPLRQWTNLKAGFDEADIWLTEFTEDQINDVLVKRIPYKEQYAARNGKLFPLNSLLPAGKEPTFLWTPIDRAFPITIKSYNHNYFGVNTSISVQLVSSDVEEEGKLMMVDLELIEPYINAAPEARLTRLCWVVVNDTHALVFGQPLLPFDGQVYWQNKNVFLPIGFNFELHLIGDLITEAINPNSEYWIVFNEDGTYFKVDKHLASSFSLGAFRNTMKRVRKERENQSYYGG